MTCPLGITWVHLDNLIQTNREHHWNPRVVMMTSSLSPMPLWVIITTTSCVDSNDRVAIIRTLGRQWYLITETERSSGRLPWSSLGTLKASFSVSIDAQDSHSDDLSVSMLDIYWIFQIPGVTATAFHRYRIPQRIRTSQPAGASSKGHCNQGRQRETSGVIPVIGSMFGAMRYQIYISLFLFGKF